VHRKLLGLRGYTNAVPIIPYTKVSFPGRGCHAGATFPMTDKPSGFQSDVLGRPDGFSRLHVTDSTVFPTIPSTTIVFSVMANAHRIGTLTGDL
jgi:choline dehydrogenase-like flavoprotein